MPTFEDPGEYRSGWHRRRRKWYVKLASRIRRLVLALGWKSWTFLAIILAVILFRTYDPMASDVLRAQGGDPIECLMPDHSAFEPVCSIAGAPSADGKVLTVRAPDGAFRRLLVVDDERGVIAADGAEAVEKKASRQDSIDIRAGDIVWRIPESARE